MGLEDSARARGKAPARALGQLTAAALAVRPQVLLAKPVTFMNNSGEAVAALARHYKVPLSRCLVVADDLDQPHAAVRLRQRGGHGGHNGLRSIIDRFGGKGDFPRLKIGAACLLFGGRGVTS